jgi:hypothetical protein
MLDAMRSSLHSASLRESHLADQLAIFKIGIFSEASDTVSGAGKLRQEAT